ncbi:MAG: hypothetical protein Q9169_004023 [Polycauliona sp. 2 TL-2023]
MATVAHCLFCFDVLSASLEKREHLSLLQVEDLWSRFQTSLEKGGQPDTAEDEINDKDDDRDLLPDSDHDLDQILSDEEPLATAAAPLPSTLRLPTISRLQASSPASASTSSTPSSASASSSQFGFEDTSSKASSTTSIFSFGRRSKVPSPARRDEQYPLFVTWNTISGRGHKSLRGCIGTFEAQDLASGLENYALTAAFDDTRFSPVRSAELATLANHITLLHTFTPCAQPLDWSLGTHGLRISFTYHGRRYGATYLPDVAVEQGWSKEETIVSLMRKAGWTGRSRDWSAVADLKAVRYEGKGEGCRWNVYRDWRDWVDNLTTETTSKT